MPISIEDVDPELRDATKRIDGAPNMPLWLMRAVVTRLPVKPVDGVRVTTERHNGIRMRVYRPVHRLPESGRAGLLWIHGGGLLFGDARQDEALCAATAVRLGVPIVSVNYRFAPQHPFPAALDDVHAGWRALLDGADALGVDPARIVIAGESAGGGLAASLVQRIVDEGGPVPIGQWLFAPMIDDRTAARRDLDDGGHLVWDNTKNRRGWGGYLGHEPGTTTPPPYAAAARRSDLSGLPPAYIAVGDIELFHDEDVDYATRLRAAAVDVTLDVVPGAPHGFENWAGHTGPAIALKERAFTWLEGVVRAVS